MTDWSHWSEQNRLSWNNRVPLHLKSEFYDLPGFLSGAEVLRELELTLLTDVKGKRLLHLQCHFGQDTLAWERHGAEVTGVDISDTAIQAADELARQLDSKARFLCCDVYALREYLPEPGSFDIVFASYGAICWLNDLDRWARLAHDYLVPGGRLVLVDFHPTLYLFDFETGAANYPYFPHVQPISEESTGSYASPEGKATFLDHFWSHPIAETLGAVLKAGFLLEQFKEWDYSPYPCFPNMTKTGEKQWRWAKTLHPLPHVFGLAASKHSGV